MIGQSIGVSGKTSGESISLQWTNSVALESTSVVKMPFGPDSVGSYEAKGEDLVINLKSGESVTVEGFFTLFDEGDELNELILQDESGVLWRAQLDPILGEFTFTEAASLDIATSSATGFAATVPGWLKIGLAALAIGGIAASKSSGGSSSKNEFAYDDGSAPEALTDLTINAEGAVITGRGQPGAEVIIKGPTGRVVGQGTVQGDGNFEVTLYEAQIDGERLVATQTDGTGKISPETSLIAPDSTAPGALLLDIDNDGAVVTVTGEPGGYVIIKNSLGALVGVGIIDDSGKIDIVLITPQINGEKLIATQTDAAGNVSSEVSVVAPDTTPPRAPEIAISNSGATVTVTGEPGAKVAIMSPTGSVIGLGTVGDTGTVTVILITPQINGETLTATQTDAAGNTSPTTSVLAPGGSAPLAPTLVIDSAGKVVTVTGESGATVMIKNTLGAVVGTGTINNSGKIDIVLITPQINGEKLIATQTDAAGNVSSEVSVVAPDTTPPRAPEIAISNSGATVTVTGEPGAKVAIMSPTGSVIGLGTVGDTGTVTVILITPQINGEKLTATQTDAAGNTSPTTSVLAPGGAAPIAPVLVIDSAGKVVTVEGEPGAKVMITTSEPFGALIGLGVVGSSGTVDIILITPQINGEKLTATQINGSGKESPKGTVTAYDTTDPTAPVLSIDSAGKVVTVTGEPSAKVTIMSKGSVIGLGTVGATGTVDIILITPQINGETLTVTQTDAAGNPSPAETVLAPGGTAPIAPVLYIDNAGKVLHVIGEPGAKVLIQDPAGVNLGADIIGPGGFVYITLLTPQTNGEKLTVTQTDTAGNTSPESTVIAPDKTPPAAPELVIDSVGKVVTVTGEVGAIVTVFNPSGSPIGVGIIGPSGKVDITLVVSQPSGQKLTATQMDSAGNESPKGTANVPSGSKSKALFAEADDDSDTMMMGKAESGATVEAKDDTAMATGLASQYSSLSIDLSAVEEFSAIDEGQEFAALLVSLDDVLAIEDGQEFAPLPEQEEGQALTITSTDNFVVDVAGYDVQPVVDPLDNLLDQDNLYI